MKRVILILMLCGINITLFASIENHKAELAGVERSAIYTLCIVGADGSEDICDIFRSECPEYKPKSATERGNDMVPLQKWADHAVNWSKLSTDEAVKFRLTSKNSFADKEIRILPSRKGITPTRVDDHTIEFTITSNGQYSVEIGDILDWREAMLIFVDPLEENRPTPTGKKWFVIEAGTDIDLHSLPHKVHSIYFADGEHDLGLCTLPSNIKNVYLSAGAWVYGAIKVEGENSSKTHIYGRGVLSGAKQPARAAHQIEVSKGASDAHIEGIVITDYSYFGIRTMGEGHTTEWVKIISGWIYNCDGICMWDNSTIRNSFIWANDDNIKLYGDNVLVEDCFCWQLNNGAIFQLGWGGTKAKGVVVRRVDIAKTAFSGKGLNHGILNRRHGGGYSRNFLFEDIVAESPVNSILNLAPQPRGDRNNTCDMDNIVLRNWTMQTSDHCTNNLVGMSPKQPITGLVIENLIINGVKIDGSNYESIGKIRVENCDPIIWK